MNEITVTEHVMPEVDARRLTEKIRLTAHTYTEAREKLIGYVEAAKSGNAHLALGYASWTAYLADVLGEEPMRLARDERREVVHLLSSEGMSTRAIAPIVGSTHTTVRRDLEPRGTNVPPTPPVFETTDVTGWDADELHEQQVMDEETQAAYEVDLANVDMETGEIFETSAEAGPTADEAERAEPEGRVEHASAPRPPVTGLDGKTYTRPEPSKPRRAPLPDAFFKAAYDLGKNVERLERLVNDDRFPQNREQVALRHENDLNRTADALAGVLRAINNQ